jgi:hypothetical protein
MCQHVTCSLTLITCLIIFMNILIHQEPPITKVQDLSHSDVQKEMPSYNSSMQFL